MSLGRTALAEVWSWRWTEVLEALRTELDYLLDESALDRWIAMRGMDYAAGLLVHRSRERLGARLTGHAMIDAMSRALASVGAPEEAFEHLRSAREELEEEGRSDAWRRWLEGCYEAMLEHPDARVRAAARAAISIYWLPSDRDASWLGRSLIESLWEASPRNDTLGPAATLLSVLEQRLSANVVSAEALLDLAWRGEPRGALPRGT